jgi:hypothetical protein
MDQAKPSDDAILRSTAQGIDRSLNLWQLWHVSFTPALAAIVRVPQTVTPHATTQFNVATCAPFADS